MVNNGSFHCKNPASVGIEAIGSGVNSPMPGTIVEIYVQAGQSVSAGDRLLVMEAMKMEHHLLAPQDGTIKEIF